VFAPACINGNVAPVTKVDVVPETYIWVYEPCVHADITVLQSSSSTIAVSNPGELLASVGEFS